LLRDGQAGLGSGLPPAPGTAGNWLGVHPVVTLVWGLDNAGQRANGAGTIKNRRKKTPCATEFRVSSQDDVTRRICFLVEQTRDAHADKNSQHVNRLMNKHVVNSHYPDHPPVCKLCISKTGYLKSIRSALLGVLIAVPAYASADVVTCFPDMEAYMVARFGPAFRDDENLVGAG